MINRNLLILTATPAIVLLLLSVISTVVSLSDSILHSAFAQNETSTGTSPTDYGVYDNSTLGIKIEVPSDWLYKEINNTDVIFRTEKSLPQNTSNTSTYVATVSVIVTNKPNGASSDLDVVSQAAIEYLQQTTPSFHLISSNTTTLAGNPAHQIVFTSLSYATGKDLNEGLGVWTLKNDKSYIILYRAGPGIDKFSIQLPIVKHMIDSFQITK